MDRPLRGEGAASLVLVGVRPATPVPSAAGGDQSPSGGDLGSDPAVERWFRDRLDPRTGDRTWRLDLVRADPDDPDPMVALLAFEDERSPREVIAALRSDVDADTETDAGAVGIRLCAWSYRPLGPSVFAEGGAGRPMDGSMGRSSGPFPSSTLYLIGNNVAPGGDATLHRWYDEVHVPDTFVHLGFVAARRFWRAADPVAADEHAHLIAYGVADGAVDAAEGRRLGLARDRVEAAAAGRPPAVPVPAELVGPRWAGYYRVRPPGA